jgi:hypothetical protein
VGFLKTMSPNELSLLANAVALAIAEDRTSDEINVLGNFFAAVGGLLSTIAAQQQSLEAMEEKQQQIQDLKKQIKKLEKS